jgi:hypothetical protein
VCSCDREEIISDFMKTRRESIDRKPSSFIGIITKPMNEKMKRWNLCIGMRNRAMTRDVGNFELSARRIERILRSDKSNHNFVLIGMRRVPLPVMHECKPQDKASYSGVKKTQNS